MGLHTLERIYRDKGTFEDGAFKGALAVYLDGQVTCLVNAFSSFQQCGIDRLRLCSRSKYIQ